MNHFTLFEQLISVGNTVLDVGGHKGDYARHFSHIVEKKGKVYSFEPHPDLYPQLENVALHSTTNNIFPFPYAASDSVGQKILFSGSDESSDGASTICIELANSDRLGSTIRKFPINTITLDFFCEELKIAPDFVKIDVEGAEDRVVLGMQKTLQQYKPTVFFEFGLADTTAPIPQHFQILRDLGYILYLVDMTRFLGNPPYSWQHIVDSSNTHLKDILFSFTDVDLLSAIPFHTNVLSVHETSTFHPFPSHLIQPLPEAQNLLTNPNLCEKNT